MQRGNSPKILVIVGPTASGKSDLAIRLAKLAHGKPFKKYGIFGTEIISADSRQVYRGMDIGTGKVTKKEMRGIPHHLLDIASPSRQFTVAQYQKLGQKAIKKILDRGKLPIVVGGTGFYIDALVHDFIVRDVKPDFKLRRKLEKLDTDKLFKHLQKLDPQRAKIIDRHNKRRLIRALEIVMTTGKPVPLLRQGFEGQIKSKYQVLSIGIRISDAELRKRIKKRLLKRLKQGMIGEIKKLRASGLSWQRLDNLGLEYRWISRYLQGSFNKEEIIKKLETEIWHYAKRQMTWFKRDKSIHWIKNHTDALTLLNKVFNKPIK